MVSAARATVQTAILRMYVFIGLSSAIVKLVIKLRLSKDRTASRLGVIGFREVPDLISFPAMA
jgi:hypothetical protein